MQTVAGGDKTLPARDNEKYACMLSVAYKCSNHTSHICIPQETKASMSHMRHANIPLLPSRWYFKIFLKHFALTKLHSIRVSITECIFAGSHKLGSIVFYKSLYATCFTKRNHIFGYCHVNTFSFNPKSKLSYLQENPIALHQGRYFHCTPGVNSTYSQGIPFALYQVWYIWIHIRRNLKVRGTCIQTNIYIYIYILGEIS